MFPVLCSLKNLMNPTRRHSETFIFYLNYRVTFLILIGFSILITTNQIVGEKIHCLASPTYQIKAALLESYCWVSSTYSVSTAYLNETGFKTPYPGIGISKNKSELTFRNYYQYIYLCFFIQALFFYLPHFIWKSFEGQRVESFYDIVNYNKKQNNGEDTTTKSPLDDAVEYIGDRWGTHRCYSLMYLFCEFLSLSNVLIQIFAVDVFLHGEFFGLGGLFSTHRHSDWISDPIHLFPIVTNCYFKKYGAGGTIDVIDSLCVLPLNALNVKMFLFVWFWFLLITVLSFFNILNISLNMFVPVYRIGPIQALDHVFDSHRDNNPYIHVLKMGNYGDWFILSSIKTNMDSLDFYRLMERMSKKLSNVTIEQKE